MSEKRDTPNLMFGELWGITAEWHQRISDAYAGNLETLVAMASGFGTPTAKAYEIRGDVAVIGLRGPLFPERTGMVDFLSKYFSVTVMPEFAANFTAAKADEKVASIIIDIRSPGGTVEGAFETADVVREAKGKKPVISMVSGFGCSAAYLIGSQADEMRATTGSVVGSIGVIASLDSFERLKKNIGIDSTVVRSSELKAPGVGEMTPTQLGAIQRRVNHYFGMFKESVRVARPKMDVDKVANGDTWIGRNALEVGLVDGITTLDKLVNSLS